MFDKTLNPPMSFTYELPCWRSKQINVQSHFRKADNEVRWKSSVSILNAFCLFFVFQHWVWTSFFCWIYYCPKKLTKSISELYITFVIFLQISEIFQENTVTDSVLESVFSFTAKHMYVLAGYDSFLFVLPENIRKPLIFLFFQGV